MGVLTPVLSALVAGVVAWLVTLRQGRTARQNWLLDKRFGVYEEVVDAFLALVRKAHDLAAAGEGSVHQALRELDTRTRVLGALTAPDLVAPEGIREQANHCIRLLWSVTDSPDETSEFIEALERLVDLMRDDLVPKALR